MQVTTILGSNSGQKQEIMAHAIRLLECAGRVIARSSLYETAPWGFECKENFLWNMKPEKRRSVIIYSLCVKRKNAVWNRDEWRDGNRGEWMAFEQ